MYIYDLIPKNEIIVSGPLREYKGELIPTANLGNVAKNNILFIYAKVGNIKERVDIPKDASPYAIVYDDTVILSGKNMTLVKVNNARRALAYAYSNFYKIDYTRIKIIGITGTNGKTSTATMIYKILRHCGYKCGYIGTGKIEIDGRVITDDFYSMTTPDPPLLYSTISKMIECGVKYVVMEVSSHSIALEKIAPIYFECGVFTNLSPEHMDFHRSMWEYYETKASMFKNCAKAIINIDDAYGDALYESLNINKASVGVVYPAEVRAVQIKDKHLAGIEYFYKEKDLIFKLGLKLSGVYNIYNSLLAAKCVYMLNIKPRLIKEALASVEEIDGRMSVINSSPKVIIDYAHTPFAMENALKSVNSAKVSGQNIILVFGCGGDRDGSKRSSMGKIALKYADKIFITEDNSRSEPFEKILADILKEIDLSDKIQVIRDRKQAIRKAVLDAEENDIILLLGKGHERYMIKSGRTFRFSERDIVKEAMAERMMTNENKASLTAEFK